MDGRGRGTGAPAAPGGWGPGSVGWRRSASMSPVSQRTSALGAVLAVLLEGGGVGVEAPAAAGRALAHPAQVVLGGAAPLEDAQAHLALGAGEEGEAHVERVVLVGGGVGVRDEGGEVLLAGGGRLVDDAGALAFTA